MSMNTDEFRQRLEREFGNEPTQPPVAADLAAGQRRLRRKRMTTIGGGLATLAALTAAAVGVSNLGETESGVRVAAGASLESKPDVLSICTNSSNASNAGKLVMFSPAAGDPELVTLSTSTLGASAIVRSGDGKTWADCFIRSDPGAEFSSGLRIYKVSKDEGFMGHAWGPGCPMIGDELEPGCDKFHVMWADRRPSQVARVEIETIDGVKTDADVAQGYLAFDYVGQLPEGYDIDADGMMMDVEVFREITFYDAQGTVLARQDFTQQKYGRDGEEVEPLDRYPSLTAHEL